MNDFDVVVRGRLIAQLGPSAEQAKMARPKDDLTADYVRSRLDYNAETGVITWKQKPVADRFDKMWNTRWAGKRAGLISGLGYWVVEIDRSAYKAHRLAWLIMTGAWPVDSIDHIDRCRSNTKWVNLRAATKSENSRNARKRPGCSSRFKGVSLREDTGLWRAHVRLNGRQKHLGCFATEEEAAEAYRENALELYCEFACFDQSPANGLAGAEDTASCVVGSLDTPVPV